MIDCPRARGKRKMRQRKMRQPKMHVRRNRLAAGERMMSWRNTDCPMDARETGRKPLKFPPEGGTPTRGFTGTDFPVGVPASAGSLRGPSGPSARNQGVVPRDISVFKCHPPYHALRLIPRSVTVSPQIVNGEPSAGDGGLHVPAALSRRRRLEPADFADLPRPASVGARCGGLLGRQHAVDQQQQRLLEDGFQAQRLGFGQHEP